jgi:hypothetical protein
MNANIQHLALINKGFSVNYYEQVSENKSTKSTTSNKLSKNINLKVSL